MRPINSDRRGIGIAQPMSEPGQGIARGGGAGFQYEAVPSGGGVARAARMLQMLVSQTALMTVAVAALELAAPYDYKPSVLLGRFSGSHETAELRAKQDATVAFQKGVQAVQAELTRTNGAYEALYQRTNMLAQQATQMEAIVLQFQQQAVAGGQQTETMGANLADLACMVGAVMQDDGLKGACGMGQQIRRGMANELAQVGGSASAIVPRDVLHDVFLNVPDTATLQLQQIQGIATAIAHRNDG
jgi:hypothetical protein